MRRIVIATNNEGKKNELKNILGGKYKVETLKEVGIDHDTVEDRDTLEGNSKKKAREIREILEARGEKAVVIADDSGLFIDALNGEPGVKSARYAGDHDDDANIDKVLEKMQGKENRKGAYRTVMYVIEEDGTETVVTGITEVEITEERRGTMGFGYDCITAYKGKTMAEMTIIEKNLISHRGKANREVDKILQIENPTDGTRLKPRYIEVK